MVVFFWVVVVGDDDYDIKGENGPKAKIEKNYRQFICFNFLIKLSLFCLFRVCSCLFPGLQVSQKGRI